MHQMLGIVHYNKGSSEEPHSQNSRIYSCQSWKGQKKKIKWHDSAVYITEYLVRHMVNEQNSFPPWELPGNTQCFLFHPLGSGDMTSQSGKALQSTSEKLLHLILQNMTTIKSQETVPTKNTLLPMQPFPYECGASMTCKLETSCKLQNDKHGSHIRQTIDLVLDLLFLSLAFMFSLFWFVWQKTSATPKCQHKVRHLLTFWCSDSLLPHKPKQTKQGHET